MAMRQTFDALSANPAFPRIRFQPTVLSIESAFNAVYSWWDEYIPFNSDCCAVADIGAQAASLTNEMLGSLGATSVPVPPQPPPGSSDPIDSLVWLAGLAIVGYALVQFGPQLKRARA